MRYVNEVAIKRIDESEPVLHMPFSEVYDNDFYTVVDKELIGQKIGQVVVDDGIDIEEEYRVIYDMIDMFLVNELVNDIFEFVEEYVHNNG